MTGPEAYSFAYKIKTGTGMTFGEIAKTLGITPEHLSLWRKSPKMTVRPYTANALRAMEATMNKSKEGSANANG